MPPRDLTDKRVLLTGASDGIGRQLALDLAHAGAIVVGVARSRPGLDSLASEAARKGLRILTIAADLTREDHRLSIFQGLDESLGGLDILINNAGVGTTGAFLDQSPEILRTVMETNLFAAAEMIRAALPRLKAGVQPLIVNVSSILGRRGFPTQSAYCASKFALQGLSDAIRAELDRMGIRVLVVNPGVTRTDFAEHEIGPRQRSPFVHREGMRVEDVSGAIVEAIRRDRVELTLTWEGRGLVILNRLFPSLAEWVIRRHLRKRFSEPG